MTKPERRKATDARRAMVDTPPGFLMIRHSDFVILSSFGFRVSDFVRRGA
jgi:hypothetical protein